VLSFPIIPSGLICYPNPKTNPKPNPIPKPNQITPSKKLHLRKELHIRILVHLTQSDRLLSPILPVSFPWSAHCGPSAAGTDQNDLQFPSTWVSDCHKQLHMLQDKQVQP
jgi:hypothetical protein